MGKLILLQPRNILSLQKNATQTYMLTSLQKITILKQRLDEHWEGVLAVPKTHQKHCFISKGSDKVIVADTSDSK